MFSGTLRRKARDGRSRHIPLTIIKARHLGQNLEAGQATFGAELIGLKVVNTFSLQLADNITWNREPF